MSSNVSSVLSLLPKKRGEMLLLLLLLCAVGVVSGVAAGGPGTDQPCLSYISVLVDVSGSVSVDPATGHPRPGPEDLRKALKSMMKAYLFRDRNACVAIYRFATNATLVYDFARVGLQKTKNELLAAVDDLQFEMVYPWYYTNWEAGLRMVEDRQGASGRKSDWVYLITDGAPTTRDTDCPVEHPGDQPCPGEVRRNADAARAVSLRLQRAGTGVVAVGMGPDISDGMLSAMSGPCPSTGCLRGWNYFHVTTIARVAAPLGRSIKDRLLTHVSLAQVVARRSRKSMEEDDGADPDQEDQEFSSSSASTEPSTTESTTTSTEPSTTTSTTSTTSTTTSTTAAPTSTAVAGPPVHNSNGGIFHKPLPHHKRTAKSLRGTHLVKDDAPAVVHMQAVPNAVYQKRQDPPVGVIEMSGAAVVILIVCCVLGAFAILVFLTLFLKWYNSSPVDQSAGVVSINTRIGSSVGGLPPPVFRMP